MQDKRIQKIVDETDISILPSLNPDGYEKANTGSCSRRAGMMNAAGKDLDQDFPSLSEYKRFIQDEDFDPFGGGRQAETLSLMEWSLSPFVLSANFYDGAVMVTYPFDHHRLGQSKKDNLTPDEDVFRHIAGTYASNHKTMANSTKCYKRTDNGFINGAQWQSQLNAYSQKGSLKDFSYLFTSNLEISIALNCCKYPKSEYLSKEWENNKESLLTYIEQVHRGIKGRVSADGGGPVSGVDIIVWNTDGTKRLKNVATSEKGEFWKVLIPKPSRRDTYKIQAYLEDCGKYGSGKIYQSEKQDARISIEKPLIVKNLRLKHVEFCSRNNLSGLFNQL